jgi:hypothetical protein
MAALRVPEIESPSRERASSHTFGIGAFQPAAIKEQPNF